MTDDDDKDPKVKTLVERDPSEPLDRFVDAETAAQLERWFGLPSFAQVEAGEVPAPKTPQEDEFEAVRERRRALLAEVDMDLVTRIEQRNVPRTDIIVFNATIEPYDATITLVDMEAIENRATIADERWVERPGDVIDALSEATPQALLRDLHRLETEFPRTWSQGSEDDWMQGDKPPPEPFLVDIVGKIDEVMRVRYKVETVPTPDIAHALDDTRAEYNQNWVALAKSGRLYNRRVTE